MPRSTSVRSRIATASGPSRPADRLADTLEKVCDYDNRRSPSGSSAARPTSPQRRRPASGRRGPTRTLIFVSTETEQGSLQLPRTARRVQRMAAILLDLGVKRGDRVLIYMPMIAEAAFAMWPARASARSTRWCSAASPPQPRQPHRRRAADGDRPAPTPACARAGGGLQAAARRGHPARCAQTDAKVLMVDRGLSAMETPAATSTTPPLRDKHLNTVVPCVAGFQRRRATSSTPAAPPASPRACSATPAARGGAGGVDEAHLLGNAGETFLHQRHRLGGRPPTSSTARCWPAWRRSVRGPADAHPTPASGGASWRNTRSR